MNGVLILFQIYQDQNPTSHSCDMLVWKSKKYKMRIDQKILKFLYKNRNDGKYHILVDKLDLSYEKIHGPIESLNSNGLIEKVVDETLAPFEDPDPDFDYTKTNTECKITQAGILYYQKTNETRYNRLLSVLAIIISLGTLIFTVWDKLWPKSLKESKLSRVKE